jgi:hypothetical protein
MIIKNFLTLNVLIYIELVLYGLISDYDSSYLLMMCLFIGIFGFSIFGKKLKEKLRNWKITLIGLNVCNLLFTFAIILTLASR